jgi:hypothetical protein
MPRSCRRRIPRAQASPLPGWPAAEHASVAEFMSPSSGCARLLCCLALAALLGFALGETQAAQDWRTASRAPAGLAPDPAATPEAVVQVYAARAIRWRGYFGVHTWIAVKPAGASAFTVYELMGYQTRRTGNGVRASQRAADGYWYGNRPHVLADVRGPGVEPLIEQIRAAVADYPYPRDYRIWPGPNSNTFIAHVLSAVPELRVDLPATAVGKDFLGPRVAALTPSGTGAQLSAFGVAGVLVGWEEGIEVNFIGLTFGINPKRLALKLPMLGNVGLLDIARTRRIPGTGSAR